MSRVGASAKYTARAPTIRYRHSAVTNAAIVSKTTLATKNAPMLGPEIHAVSRIAHIDRTGYSSHGPDFAWSHASRYGKRSPVNCCAPRRGTMSLWQSRVY